MLYIHGRQEIVLNILRLIRLDNVYSSICMQGVGYGNCFCFVFSGYSGSKPGWNISVLTTWESKRDKRDDDATRKKRKKKQAIKLKDSSFGMK
ncbi:hypothetical protein BUE80_DR010812 [Diplocarpon rosae]|nr:hypothetical protein BUE80_DR010812 [Diplocarpon rosae]